MLTILLLSQGVPMLLFGDEVLRTQKGNNNVYCQNNELSWFDWDLVEKEAEMHAYVKQLIAFRREHAVLRRKSFFSGEKNARGLYDVEWHGCRVREPGWNDPLCKVLGLTLGARGDGPDVLVVMNMQDKATEFDLPAIDGREWMLRLQTSEEEISHSTVQVRVPSRSMVVFESE
jgi:glycogen operon protein